MINQEAESFDRAFFETLESGIEKLPQETVTELYRPCAIGCVQNFVLREQQRQFAECGGDLDAQYEKYGKSEFFFADIIERGHIYEMGYPRCLCPVVESGLAHSPVHCECSRQSILYVLQTLLPEKKITVERLHTVLDGADECRFRAAVE
jgi:hypothetical protein